MRILLLSRSTPDDLFNTETSEIWVEKERWRKEENRLVEKERMCGVRVDSQSVGI